MKLPPWYSCGFSLPSLTRPDSSCRTREQEWPHTCIYLPSDYKEWNTVSACNWCWSQSYSTYNASQKKTTLVYPAIPSITFSSSFNKIHCLNSTKRNPAGSSVWAGANTINDFLEITAQRKAAGEKGPATELEPGTYTLSWNFSHEVSVPAANPLSPIALCTGGRCVAIQRPLRTHASRLVLCLWW